MDKSALLDQAKEFVTKDRNKTHGAAEDNFNNVAMLWSCFLDRSIDATEVALMMTLFKIARAKHNRSNPENWLDGIGYLACGGEIATKDLSS